MGLFPAIVLALVVISTSVTAQGRWLSFSPDKSLSTSRAVTHGDVRVDDGAALVRCRVPLTFPGVALDYPDDNGLLAGKFATFSFESDDIRVSPVNYNGTLEPDKRGKPDLPLVRLQVRIPRNAKLHNVTALNADYRPVDGEYSLAPVQEQLAESFVKGEDEDTRAFMRDEAIYGQNARFSFPVTFEEMICHGTRFLEITYCPLAYNPVTKKLYATVSADIAIDYARGEASDDDAPTLFSRAVNSATFNGTGTPDPETYASSPGKFIVVSRSSLINTATFQDYIAYRQAQGYVLVETVNADNLRAADITVRIKSLYASPKMDYVLIIGDETLIPIPIDSTSYHYKTWSRLNGTDNIEDVGLGIFLCDNEARLRNIVQHQKWQEAGGTWSKTQLSTSGSEVANGVWNRFSTGHHGTVHLDGPNGGLGYTVHRVYQVASIPTQYGGSNIGLPIIPFESWTMSPTPFYTNSSAATAEVIKRWNEGVLNISHRDHGSVGGPSSPRMSYTLFSNRQITSTCSPFFTSLNCLTGNFKGRHTTNFSYMAQTAEHGPCANIGATVVTYSGDNDRVHEAMYTAMYPKTAGATPIANVGQIWLVAHLKGQAHSRTYFHIFGDPLTNLSMGQGGKKFITLVSPNGGEVIECGTTCDIVWGDNINGNVKIDLIKGTAVAGTLAASVPSNGSYTWNVAADITPATDYKIKVTSVDSAALFGQSSTTFRIVPEFVIASFPYNERCDTLDSNSTELPYKWDQPSTNQVSWVVWSGPTPSRVGTSPNMTGPLGDHTSGNGKYIYLEASGNANERGTFTTPKFNLTALVDPRLSFWCHMFSDTNLAGAMGTLYLDINVDGVWKDSVFKVSGDQGDRWVQQTVNLNQHKGARVMFRFRGVIGNLWTSDICLDDFTISSSETRTADTRGAAVPCTFDLVAAGSKLTFHVPGEAAVTIHLYDLRGQRVKTLYRKRAQPGIHVLPLGAISRAIAHGTYLCRMNAHGFSKTIPVMF
ncbi:MAG: hypothetical protein JXA71_13675 [Chitinispirillaceae bacterium]|nr:hypothetical protein [Chitinispirillaceae bacterium]